MSDSVFSDLGFNYTLLAEPFDFRPYCYFARDAKMSDYVSKDQQIVFAVWAVVEMSVVKFD